MLPWSQDLFNEVSELRQLKAALQGGGGLVVGGTSTGAATASQLLRTSPMLGPAAASGAKRSLFGTKAPLVLSPGPSTSAPESPLLRVPVRWGFD